MTRREIAEYLGRSYNSVNQKICAMGIAAKPSKVGRRHESEEHLKETQRRKHARYYERHKDERKAYQRQYYIELKKDDTAFGEYKRKAKIRRCLTIMNAIHG